MKYCIYLYIFFVYTVLALLIGKMPFLYINLEYHSIAVDYTQAILLVALALIFLAPYIVIKYLKLSLTAKIKTTRFLRGVGVCTLMGLVALETYFYSSAVTPQAKEFWLIYTLGEVAVLNVVFCILLSLLFRNVKLGDSVDTFQQVLGKPDKTEELEEGCIDYIYSSGLCASFDSKRSCYAIKYIPGSDYYKMFIEKNTGRIGKLLHRLKNNNRTEMRLLLFAMLVFGFVFLMLFASRPETVEQRSKAVKTQSSKYNLGIATDTKETFSNVDVKLLPKGEHSGGFLNKNKTSWYMHITHWVPPKAVIVSFNAPNGKSYKFRKTISLPKDFRGNILITIKKNKNGYYIELKTAKIRELT